MEQPGNKNGMRQRHNLATMTTGKAKPNKSMPYKTSHKPEYMSSHNKGGSKY